MYMQQQQLIMHQHMQMQQMSGAMRPGGGPGMVHAVPVDPNNGPGGGVPIAEATVVGGTPPGEGAGRAGTPKLTKGEKKRLAKEKEKVRWLVGLGPQACAKSRTAGPSPPTPSPPHSLPFHTTIHAGLETGGGSGYGCRRRR